MKEKKPTELPHPKYFEGILQLREPTQELLEFIDREMEKSGRVGITKRVKEKDGMDLYVTSQHMLQNIGKKIKENFTGEYKLSSELHTKDGQTSRDLYRITIFFRQRNFRIGGIADYRGDPVKVIAIGKRVTVKDVKNGRKFMIDFDQIK